MYIVKGAMLASICAVTLAGCTQQAGEAMPQPIEVSDAAGAISLPEGFDRWPTLGAWATASAGPDTPVNELHTVYVSPGGIESYRKDGVFADGTVLVKAVSDVKAAPLTTGNAHWAAKDKVWFVMVKDSKNSHKDNPLWREGWGWALFDAGDPTKQVATSFEETCQTCHEPAKDSDWIYSAAYSVLHDGEPKKASWDPN
ncbi:cytochrome P460 family protein [Erythrobacter sp.]|uniref:cytochrome P460 family protein n=1 Tax=Erythrobacter sp. TaxID=1042 RepID=UPI00311E7E39